MSREVNRPLGNKECRADSKTCQHHYSTSWFSGPGRKPLFQLVLVELFFALAATVLWLAYAGFSIPPSPAEISLYKVYWSGVGVPVHYLQVWAVVALDLRLPILSSFVLAGIVGTLALLTSSYLLVRVLHDFVARRSFFAPVSTTEMIVHTAAAFLLAFNPLFTALYFRFTVGCFALVNLALAGSLVAVRYKGPTGQTLAICAVIAFVVAFATNAFTLSVVFFLSLYLLLIFPAARISRSLRTAAINLVIIFAIVIASDPILWPTLGFVYNLSTTTGVESGFHVVNLVYYNFTNAGPQLAFFTGLTTVVYAEPPVPDALLLTGSIVLAVALAPSIMNRKLALFPLNLVLLAELVGIELMNFSIGPEYTVMNSLLHSVVSSHLVRYNHLGLLLTPFDFDTLLVYVYWYVLAALIVIGYSSRVAQEATPSVTKNAVSADHASSPASTSQANEASGHYARKSRWERNRWLSRSRSLEQNWWGPCLVVVAVALMSTTSLGMFSWNPRDLTNSPAYEFVSSANFTGYDQLLLSNASSFLSAYVYPQGTQPLGNDFPFYQNAFSLMSSPFFTHLDRTFPANTFVYQAQGGAEIPGSYSLNSGYSAYSNWNSSNVISGRPIFVLGTESDFDSYIERTSFQTLPGSASFFLGANDSNTNYEAVPPRNENLTAAGFPLQVSFDVSLHSGTQGGFLVGLAQNSSNPYGYGNGNAFLGVTTFVSNNITFANIAYNIYGPWYVVDAIPIGGLAVNFSFSILVDSIGDVTQYVILLANGAYAVPITVPASTFGFVSMKTYLEGNSNITYSVNVSNQLSTTASPSIPIFYDSYFGSTKTFTNSLIGSAAILEGPDFNFTTLALSNLVWSSAAQVLEPASYAIDSPESGWFQTFNSEYPQGAYYAEGIPAGDLPLQWGYGASMGYAESILPNSSLTVPVQSESGSDVVWLNVLFSPLGGPLEVRIGDRTSVIDTVANSSYYHWIEVQGQPVSSISFEDLAGDQSVNLVLIASRATVASTVANLRSEVSRIPTYSLDAAAASSIKLVSSGHFSTTAEKSSVSVHSNATTPVIIELPEDVNYGLSATCNPGAAQIAPAWGNFLGVLLVVTANSTAHVSIAYTSAAYFEGLISYIPVAFAVGATIWYSVWKKRRRLFPL